MSTLLLQGITVFVCLMPDDELDAAREEHKFDFFAELTKRHGNLMGELKQVRPSIEQEGQAAGQEEASESGSEHEGWGAPTRGLSSAKIRA